MNIKKRSWEIIYDELLTHQANLSHDLEQMYFRSFPRWMDARRVMDFGAGNCQYTKLLAMLYPEKEYVCVEKNGSLAEIGRHGISSSPLKVVIGSYQDLGEGNCFDLIFSRHTLSYLSDDQRQDFFAWAARNTTQNAGLVIIDAEDDFFRVDPRLPLLESGNKKFQDDLDTQGGNRQLKDLIGSLIIPHGFSHITTHSIVVHSDISERKNLMSKFMLAVAEIDHGTPLPAEVNDEIERWKKDRKSYMQYGMFGAVFAKG